MFSRLKVQQKVYLSNNEEKEEIETGFGHSLGLASAPIVP